MAQVKTFRVMEDPNPARFLGSMRGKSNLSSSSAANSPRPLMMPKRQQDGAEAPRNSLEWPLETTSRHPANNEDLMVRQSSKMNLHRSGMPIKALMNEEMGVRENVKRSGLGVVARLMGMDTLPSEVGQVHAKVLDDNSRTDVPRGSRFETSKTQLDLLSSTTFKKAKEELSLKKPYSSPSTKSITPIKPHRREHPQEEILQKFKKEFEAWQASKFWERSRNSHENFSGQGVKNEQVLKLENLYAEKMARYSSSRFSVQKGDMKMESNKLANKDKITRKQLYVHDGNFDKQQRSPRIEDDMTIRSKLAAKNFEASPLKNFQDRRSESSSPTRIVILKPSSESTDEIEEPLCGSSEIFDKGSSMEDFLEEVKERLRLEMEGKGRSGSLRRFAASHASLHERSTDPKQLAREIAKHVRESVTRDLGPAFVKSECASSYSNDFHVNVQASPDFIKQDTRKFMSERLKSVLNDDTQLERSKRSDGLAIKKVQSKSTNEFIKMGKGASFWEDKKAVNESIPKYLRREHVKSAEFNEEATSPTNLMRSFSAPISRTAFGKLLLEDQALTGAQMQQRHEACEKDPAIGNRNKKDGLSLKGRVSNLKRNFTLRGKIFGKKIPSAGESTVDMLHDVKSIETTASLVRNFSIVQDNPTEVPPSPVSFSSSPIHEHCSPLPALEVPYVEDHSSAQVSGELCMNLPESTSQLVEIESKGFEELATEAEHHELSEIADVQDHAESYVRDILVVSGLYEALPSEQAMTRLDGQMKPISSFVFDELEEKCCKVEKLDYDASMDRKMLFDLVNEALPMVFEVPMARLTWTRGLTQYSLGKKLLDELLHQINLLANPKIDQPRSVDQMVAWDLHSTPWSTTSREVICSIGRDLESVIIGELINELVLDLNM
ncbi:hypothetical protein AXF42_Ash020209 [Apostasia shenzhenica]|uniref:DUF4378 domain-containing protein n=1 Tax=Apostasia shenzhenica TaxID=1088818 RepID=A0A2H9ZX04_9ASPA|nr:hypothetical protein AXF42_Ash020209 [Apostasia shenzhenica]